VLSSSYLRTVVPSAESAEVAAIWAIEHPGTLIPVLVRRSELPPRFWQLSPVDLRELTDERVAVRRLLGQIRGLSAASRDGESQSMIRFPGRRPPIWSTDIPARNIYFTGRDDMLRELRRRLTTDITALLPHSLQGPSGVGKTQLAIEYAHRFGPDYDIVWWIPAESRATARHALGELAVRLDLGGPAAETGELIRAAIDALRTGQPYQRWLLIFDNAAETDSISHLLLTGPGHTVVTSRDQAWASLADVLDVDVYSRAESKRFLLRRIPGLAETDAEMLAEELGDLPLALEHVAGWLATTHMTVGDYLTQLRAHAEELLASAKPVNYPVSVAATWTISMNRLHDQNPAAAELLELCAFIGPEPVALSLLAGAPAGTLPGGLAAGLGSARQLTAILEAIESFSLARIGEGTADTRFAGPSLQQHRLVQAVVRDTASADDQAAYRTSAHLLLAAADPGDPEIPGNWSVYAALLPHVLSSGAATDPDPRVRGLVLHEARALWRRGEFRACLGVVTEALQAWSGMLDESDPDMSLAYRERSNAMQGLGMFADALRVDQTVNDLMMERLGPDHPQTLRAAGLLAVDLRRLGRFEPARELDQRVLDVSVRDLGRDDIATLRLAHNVAVNHRLAAEFPTALEIDRYNSELYPGVAGPDAFSTLFSVNNVARDLRECGQYFEALSMQEITYSRYREVYGADNPESLRAMKNLAVTRRKAGRYAEASELADEVLSRHQRKFGDLHPETLAATTNLANDRRCLGDYVTGRGLADTALRGFRKIFGSGHGYTASAAVNLAALVRLSGDLAQARSLNEEALGTLQPAFGRNHRYTLSCAVNLASDLGALGEVEAARELGAETFAALREVSGEDHPYTLSCAVNLALDLRALGDREAYRALFTDTMDRYQRTLGSAHPEAAAAAARIRAVCDIEPPPI
jgi:tetratricopeptide (TPR) repeat protein